MGPHDDNHKITLKLHKTEGLYYIQKFCLQARDRSNPEALMLRKGGPQGLCTSILGFAYAFWCLVKCDPGRHDPRSLRLSLQDGSLSSHLSQIVHLAFCVLLCILRVIHLDLEFLDLHFRIPNTIIELRKPC